MPDTTICARHLIPKINWNLLLRLQTVDDRICIRDINRLPGEGVESSRPMPGCSLDDSYGFCIKKWIYALEHFYISKLSVFCYRKTESNPALYSCLLQYFGVLQMAFDPNVHFLQTHVSVEHWSLVILIDKHIILLRLFLAESIYTRK